MKFKSTSIHKINADKDLNLLCQKLWLLCNLANNYYRAKYRKGFDIKRFSPQLKKSDWEKIYLTSSPSRALSDLFWQKIEWQLIRSELGKIHIFDTGCGSGNYALRLQDFSENSISSYCGIDPEPREIWAELTSKHNFITLKKFNSNQLLPLVPQETNLFITQSAVEHFENDLSFFEQINHFIKESSNNVIQIHLFPSAACLKLYPLHGVRQYTHRTISKIASVFNSVNSYAILFELGGKNSYRLHYQFITKPLTKENIDWRDTKTEAYRVALIKAINQDIATSSNLPVFYALVIHSNYKEKIFENMKSLT
jgi:SAM-dependent methyltransferase